MNKKAGCGLVVGLLLAAGCSDGGGTPGTGGAGGKGGKAGTGGVGGSGTGTGGTINNSGGQGGTVASGGTNAGGGGATGVAGAAGSVSPAGGASGAGVGGSGAGGGGGAPWLSLPANLPPALAVPAGATLKIRDHATGAQVYTCTASTPAAGGAGGAAGAAGAGGVGGAGGATTYSWVLKAPDAKLYDMAGTQVGTHSAGPTWTSVDASLVVAARAAQADAPLTDAIPWLLLRATLNAGVGVFSDITYVLRANTTGGKAPATGCSAATAGTETRVDYTADYYFYTGGAGVAWLVEPTIPAAIAAPTGATVKVHDHAIGAQVYTCTGASGAGGAGGATAYAWTLKAPDAILYDATFASIGTHGAGPNWTSTVDGSVVIAARVSQADAPQTTGVPWLLLKTSSTTGTGVFSDVTYVHRVNTVGGKAPATGCDAAAAGTETRVNYSADYYFFTGGAVGGAGGAGGAAGMGGAAGAGGAAGSGA